MQLREKLRRLQKYEHKAHVATLFLVVVNVLADRLLAFLHTKIEVATVFTHLLHWFHYLSIALVFTYTTVRLLFSRRPSREVARLLPKPKVQKQASQNDSSVPRQYGYRGRPVPDDDIAFVTDPGGPLAIALFEMNQTAYEGSAFELTRSVVQERNAAIVERNSVSFMLFRDPNREATTPLAESTVEDFVGYTAVFPVTDVGKDVYLRGLFPDSRFPECFICRNGEKAAMLLFFAMHLRKPYMAKAAGQRYSLLLARCIEEHIKRAARAHASIGDQLEVMVQSEDEGMREHYRIRGFEPTEKRSHEGFPFYSRSIVVI